MSAYACEPGRGSEPGAGWAWACAAARDHDVWVLTHVTNRAPITAALAADPQLAARLHPVFLANSGWVTKLRRPGPMRYLYYWIWQLGPCRRESRRLGAAVGFDICHHLTYASDWMPAGISALDDVPFIWGPVGGSSTKKSPRLWARLGARMFVSELARAMLLDPVRSVVGRRLARRAAVVLGQNADVADAFAPVPVLVEPNIALESSDEQVVRQMDRSSRPMAVYAGRLIELKGLPFALAALALPAAAGWQLDIYGEGPMRRRLERQAVRLDVADRVRFLGSRPRAEVREALSRADVMLFPSLRDAGGWSVAEAMAAGCPVVCLDVGGPATLVGVEDGVVVSRDGDIVGRLASGLNQARNLCPRREQWSACRLPYLLQGLYTGLARRPVGQDVTSS